MPRAVLAKDVLWSSSHHTLYIIQHVPTTPGHSRGSSMRFAACRLPALVSEAAMLPIQYIYGTAIPATRKGGTMC